MIRQSCWLVITKHSDATGIEPRQGDSWCKEQRPRGLSARVQDRGLARGTGGHCSQGSESAGNTSPSAGEVRPSLWYVREVVLHVYGCGCSCSLVWGSLLGGGVLAGERGGPLGERASGVTRLSR